MALVQTLAQMRVNVRQLTDTAGTSALLRHTDAIVNDYINRGLAALHRLLTQNLGSERYLASSTLTTVAATTTYALPSDFSTLISADLTINGAKGWLDAFEMHERASLTDPATAATGIPYLYRLRGGNIELLPTPGGIYTGTIWYVPAATQLTSDGQTFDTIDRLDDWVIWHASRPIAARDKNWELIGRLDGWMAELRGDIETIARSRDKNAVPRIVDESMSSRSGRSRRWR